MRLEDQQKMLELLRSQRAAVDRDIRELEMRMINQFVAEMDRATAEPAPWVGIAMVKQWAAVLRRMK